jgi:hypothetical protein
MPDNRNTKELPLRLSICTDTPVGADIFPFGDEGAKHLTNTGIERNGGIAPLYETETTFPTAGVSTMVARDGTVVQVDAANNVRLNDQAIGNVGPLAVASRGAIKGYSDAAWTASNTILGIVKIGSAIKVDEINPSTGAVLNTRSITFTMPSVAITNTVLVKYVGMNFADSLTFILSNNLISYSLVEANAPAIAVVGGQTWTVRTLEADTWHAVAWSPTLSLFVAVGQGGTHYAASSQDGITWTPRTLATGNWRGVVWAPALNLFVAVSTITNFAATSPDGIAWTIQTIEAGNWASIAWSSQLSLLVTVGLAGTGFYAASSPDGVNWTTRTLENDNWISVAWSPALGLFVAISDTGPTHYVATSSNGTTWSTGTIEADFWHSVAWSPALGIFVAIGAGPTHFAASSTDGLTWTPRTLAASNTWKSVTWSPQLSLFMAVGQNSATVSAISSDGINWTVISLENNAWESVVWSQGLGIFAAVGSGGTHYAATTAQIVLGTNLCWKFAANKYIIGNQGTSGSFAIGDIAATMTGITDATWAVIDTFAGTAFSRAILSFNVKKNASNLLTGIGEVGYNQTGTYSATVTYYGVALGAVTATISNNISGPGYAEATFTRSDTGTNIYYYQAPIMGHNPGPWFDVSQSQTQTLANGYGRLSDFNANTLGSTCSLRIVMLNGQPSLISAGVIGQESGSPLDCLGVPITNVGEFDELYCPHVVDNGSTQLACIYRHAGVLFFFVIKTGATNRLQAVSDNVYSVNCLSPINAIDVANKTLNLGNNDYNGRILFRSTAAIIATAKCVGLMQGDYSNSIDFGDKSITQTFSTATDVVPGIELPSFIDRAVSKYGVNVYLADLYSVTYQSLNITFTNGDLTGELYVSDTRIPFGMGYPFQARTMQTEIETIFTGVGVVGSADIDFDYLYYETGNDTPGIYQSFVLFGQTYLFDGKQIWFVSFNGSLFAGRGSSPVCPAEGMILTASTPTSIFFLSAFDNSLYVFDGGRSLIKAERMNGLEAIQNGVYSVRDNTILLQTANNFIWIRDGKVTENAKKANQAGALGLFSTVNGPVIANNTMKWQYTFYTQAGATVVPLTWKSAYMGIMDNRLGIMNGFYATLYSPTKAAAYVILTVDTFDVDGADHQEKPFTINPADWDSLGFWRSARVQPERQRTLAAAFGLKTTDYVIINRASIVYQPSVPAIPGARKSG